VESVRFKRHYCNGDGIETFHKTAPWYEWTHIIALYTSFTYLLYKSVSVLWYLDGEEGVGDHDVTTDYRLNFEYQASA